MECIKSYYYQIKGKSNGDETGFYGSTQNWVFPPIFSGKVEALDKKQAKIIIEEKYSKQFPLRVLSKDLDSNEFLLSIEEIKEGSRLEKLFEQQNCKLCNSTFYVIDKYNNSNETNKGFDFCSQQCSIEDNKLRQIRYNEENVMNGIHVPVIYKITNKITGLCYIGKTTQAFTFRWYQHFFQSGGTSKFHEEIKKYEATDWIFEVQEIIKITQEFKKIDDANKYILERESYWISFYDSVNNGYNSKK